MKHKNPSSPNNLAVAALTFALDASGVIQLLPAGEFRAIDGRPNNAPCWKLDAGIAAALIAKLTARANDVVIDYEHQTILSEKNGQPAPASGWMKGFEWRDGAGLFATVEWTERAKGMIDSGEYKYISPTIVYDPKTGAVLNILHAALTNFAAIDGMNAVTAQAAAKFASLSIQLENTMDELLEQLRWLLNLPVGTTADDILAQLQKLMDQVKQASGATAAASFDLGKYLSELHGQVATLKSATPDPAQFIPMTQYTDLQATVATLTAKIEDGERDGLMTAALADGRILPAQKDYWGAQPVAALSAYLAVAQPIKALTGLQTGGSAPNGDGVTAPNAEQAALCTQLNISPEEFQATLKAESA